MLFRSEEVLELNFRRARRLLFDLVELDESLLFSPHFESLLSAFGTISETIRVDSGMRFMYIVKVSWSMIWLSLKQSILSL